GRARRARPWPRGARGARARPSPRAPRAPRRRAPRGERRARSSRAHRRDAAEDVEGRRRHVEDDGRRALEPALQGLALPERDREARVLLEDGVGVLALALGLGVGAPGRALRLVDEVAPLVLRGVADRLRLGAAL